MNFNREDLSQLKVGDKVALWSSRQRAYRIVYVKKITNTQIHCVTSSNAVGEEFTTKFRRDNGSEIGGDKWYSTGINLLTNKIIDEVELNRWKNKAYNLMRNSSLDKMSKEHLIKICDAIEGK